MSHISNRIIYLQQNPMGYPIFCRITFWDIDITYDSYGINETPEATSGKLASSWTDVAHQQSKACAWILCCAKALCYTIIEIYIQWQTKLTVKQFFITGIKVQLFVWITLNITLIIANKQVSNEELQIGIPSGIIVCLFEWIPSIGRKVWIPRGIYPLAS